MLFVLRGRDSKAVASGESKKSSPSLSAPILWYLLSNKINFLFFLRPYNFFPALNWIFLVNCIALTIQFKPLILRWIQCVPLLSLLKTGWKLSSSFFCLLWKRVPFPLFVLSAHEVIAREKNEILNFVRQESTESKRVCVDFRLCKFLATQGGESSEFCGHQLQKLKLL